MYTRNEINASLTPEIILELLEKDKDFSDNLLLKEKALLFCTLLYNRWWEIRKEQSNVFQKISTNLLITLLTRDNYKLIINKLEALGIIEIEKSYIPGHCPKGYRLKNEILKSKPIARRILLTETKTRLKKLGTYFLNKVFKYYPYLQTQFENLKLIHIDSDEALEWIDNNEKLKEEQKLHYFTKVKSISNGVSPYISVALTNDRIFTTLTNLPSGLRPFLYINDDKIGRRYLKVQIDGSNTQPALLCVKMKFERISPEKDFWDFSMNGNLYLKLGEEILQENIEEEIKSKINRDWAKMRILDTILYSKDNGMYLHKMENCTGLLKEKKIFSIFFMKRFPIVWNYLLSKKNGYSKIAPRYIKGKSKKNFGGSQLAIDIQKMESYLWIHRLLPEIPQHFIYMTIHDSVILFNPSQRQIDFIEKKFKELSLEIYGVALPIHTEEIECHYQY